MKILVTGDREWDDYDMMKSVLLRYAESNPIIVHGACRGADLMADKIAFLNGWERHPHPALWHKYHRAAGAIRNRQMLDTEKPDLVIAFHKNFAASKGTKDMVAYAEKKKVRVIRVPAEPSPLPVE